MGVMDGWLDGWLDGWSPAWSDVTAASPLTGERDTERVRERETCGECTSAGVNNSAAMSWMVV